MASLTGVGDSVTLDVADRGETVTIAISGTYNMTLLFQREKGSPGSGSWETLKTYTTANATVSEDYVTQSYNESLRVYVSVDTSGTAVVTLTDSDKTVDSIKDAVGNDLVTFKQSGVVLPAGLDVTGPVEGPTPVNVTTSTVTITADEHAGRVVTLNRAAGVTATLPAATGTGNVYKFFVGTTVTSNDDIIQVANATDVIQGVLAVVTDIAGVVVNTTATSDTITMNGSTTGGVIGSYVEITDVASGFFACTGALVATGAEATPFSAAVS